MHRSTTVGRPLDALAVERVRELVGEVVDQTLSAGGRPATPPSSGSPNVSPSAPRSSRARWVSWRAQGSERPGTPRRVAPLPVPAPGPGAENVVALGADHGGFALKRQLARYLEEELKVRVLDCGTYSEESVDYPDIARDVALAVRDGKAAKGVVIDAMGIGSGMAANRIPGVLCAVCHDVQSVRNAREHNDANVLSIGSRAVNPGQARQLVRIFLRTPHGGGRHARRVRKIRELERIAGTEPQGAR